MLNVNGTSAVSTNRGMLAGRIAGAAVAATLFLGAPLLTTLAVAPAIAAADSGGFFHDIGDAAEAPVESENFENLGFDECASGKKSHDCDGDGIDNLSEVRIGTDLNNIDSDGDGYGDGVELKHHTDPLSAKSNPKPVADSSSGSDSFSFDSGF